MSLDVCSCLALYSLALCCLLPRPLPQVLLVSCSRAMSSRFHAHVSCPLLAHSCVFVGGVARIRSWRQCRASSAHRACGGSCPLQDVRRLLLQLPDSRYVRACKSRSVAPSVHPSIRPLLHTHLFWVASKEIRATFSTFRAVLFLRSFQIRFFEDLVVAYVCTPRVTCAGEFILSRHMNDVELQNEQVSSRCLSQCRAVCRSAGQRGPMRRTMTSFSVVFSVADGLSEPVGAMQHWRCCHHPQLEHSVP